MRNVGNRVKGTTINSHLYTDHLPQTDTLSKKGLVQCVRNESFSPRGPQASWSLNFRSQCAAEKSPAHCLPLRFNNSVIADCFRVSTKSQWRQNYYDFNVLELDQIPQLMTHESNDHLFHLLQILLLECFQAETLESSASVIRLVGGLGAIENRPLCGFKRSLHTTRMKRSVHALHLFALGALSLWQSRIYQGRWEIEELTFTHPSGPQRRLFNVRNEQTTGKGQMPTLHRKQKQWVSTVSEHRKSSSLQQFYLPSRCFQLFLI